MVVPRAPHPPPAQFCPAKDALCSQGCGVCLEQTSHSRSSQAVAKVARYPWAKGSCQMQLRNLAPHPRPCPPPGPPIPDPGEAGLGASACARARVCAYLPVVKCTELWGGEEGMLGSAYLWLLTDKWRSVQRLARACLAADPGKPGAARSTPGRASTARIAGLAPKEARLRGLGQLRARRPPPPLPRARPARPGRPPRRSSSLSGSCSATRAGRQWLGRLRGRPRARPIAARRSEPQPPGSVLLRCPHLLQLSSARSGSRAGRRGRRGGGSGKGVLAAAPGPGHSVEPGGQRTEERAPGAARQPPVRSPATEAGGAPGPVGRGWGGGGPGRVRGAGARRVEEPLQPEPDRGQKEEEEKEEVLEAAAGCRLRAELHCHILGFWAAGGAARPLELVESTREPPQEPQAGAGALLIFPSGAGCLQETLLNGFLNCQPTYLCWTVNSLGGSGHGGKAPAPSPADLSLERLGVRVALLHFYV